MLFSDFYKFVFATVILVVDACLMLFAGFCNLFATCSVLIKFEKAATFGRKLESTHWKVPTRG